jgi:hypothetical protein
VTNFPIYSRLSGGLGNQIYMLCLTWLVAQSKNQKILLDEASIDNPQHSNRVFDIFEIDFSTTVENRFTRIPSNSSEVTLYRFLARLARRKLIPGEIILGDDGLPLGNNVYFATKILCDSRIAARARELGFPKSVKIKNPSTGFQLLESSTQEENVLAVHLRLSDIRTFESGNRMLDPEYFSRNIRLIHREHTIDSIWVFTDEPEAVPDFLPIDFEYRVISSTNGLTTSEELVIMSKCSVLLGSRSTFSFWAGFWNLKQENIYYPGGVVGFPMWRDSLN